MVDMAYKQDAKLNAFQRIVLFFIFLYFKII